MGWGSGVLPGQVKGCGVGVRGCWVESIISAIAIATANVKTLWPFHGGHSTTICAPGGTPTFCYSGLPWQSKSPVGLSGFTHLGVSCAGVPPALRGRGNLPPSSVLCLVLLALALPKHSFPLGVKPWWVGGWMELYVK